MPCSRCVFICMLLEMFTGLPSSGFSAISVALWILASRFTPQPTPPSSPTPMQTGRAALTLVAPPRAIVSTLDPLLSRGRPSGSLRSLVPVLRLSIERWPMSSPSVSGVVSCFRSYLVLLTVTRWSTATTFRRSYLVVVQAAAYGFSFQC